MIQVTRRARMAALAQGWRRRGLSIGLVPTMGALHEGHASLIARARQQTGKVVVSVFVNPTQFGPKEDFARYPRTLGADLRLCRRLGADAVFCPSSSEMYPPGPQTFVEVAGLSDILCGGFRPGHFRGVATVVLKLFEAVRPDRAYFGEKDFQQLAIIRRLAEDLGLPVRIVGCPVVREKDGLALSSRNRYLTSAERAAAPLLHEALARAARGASLASARGMIRRIPGASIDYVELVDANTLLRPGRRAQALRLLAAIRLSGSKTRLIDNVPVKG